MRRQAIALLQILAIGMGTCAQVALAGTLQRAWVERVAPPAHDAPSLAYDTARGQIVLVGSPSLSGPAETWEWDGSGWTQRGSAAFW